MNTILRLVLLLLVAPAAHAATIQRTATLGQSITLTRPGAMPRPLVTFTKPGQVAVIGLPGGDDISFKVGTTATPAGATIRREVGSKAEVWLGPAVFEVLPDASTTTIVAPGGNVELATPHRPPIVPPAGVTLLRITSGQTASLVPSSNTWYVAAGYEYDRRATLTGAGTVLRVPSNTSNVRLIGIDLAGKSKAEDTIRTVGDNIRDVVFEDCWIAGGKNNVVWQSARIEGPCTTFGLTFRNCGFIDPLGDVEKTGQNLFIANVRGLTVEDCFGVNAGARQPWRDVYTHFGYIKEGNELVVVRRCLVADPQAVAIQARGPARLFSEPDNGDPGPLVEGNVIYRAPIAIMVNGRRATVRDNLVIAGVHTNRTNTGGESGVYASVGRLVQQNNLMLRGKRVDPGTVLKPWNNAGRADVTVYGSRRVQWGYNLPVATIVDTGNVVRKDVILDLDDLVARGRVPGTRVAELVAEAKRRAAAKVSLN